MNRSLIPFFFGDVPGFEEEMRELSPFTGRASDISISEDEKYVYVETPLPGVLPKDIEVTFHNGQLCVKGSHEESEEDKRRKFYRKAKQTFSYCVHVPGEIDESAPPEATAEHGVMRVRFSKQKKSEPRRIEVRVK